MADLKKAVFAGFNALGDTLCTTPVVNAFKKQNRNTFVIYVVQNATFCRVLEANPDIDLVLYSENLYLHGLTIFSIEWLRSLPLDIRETTYRYHFDMNGVCSRKENFHEHISIGFSKLLNIPIDSIRPIVCVTEEERRVAESFVRKPYFIFSSHSVSNPKRESGNGYVKDWPRERWLCLAERIHSWGDFDIIAVGSEMDERINSPHIRNLYGLPIKIVAALLRDAVCVVTLENGIAHLGAGVDAPMVIVYSNIVPLAWACPETSSRCRVLYGDPQNMELEEVSAAVKETAGIP